MAEVERDQKTEEATPKRKRESETKGDVLISRELATALAMLAGTAWLAIAGPWAMLTWGDMLAQGLTLDPKSTRSFDIGPKVMDLLMLAALPLAALFAITIAGAMLGPILLGTLGFRSEAFAPKANRLNPGAGLKRMFGPQGLAELGKSLAKVALLGSAAWWSISGDLGRLNGLAVTDARTAAGVIGTMLLQLVATLAIVLFAIAAIDIPLQVRQRNIRLRMSKQEVRDEMKETEGAPELKAAVRARQQMILSGSARKAVSEASVILTNPTHFAVALRYRPGLDAAPMVVARGRGPTAEAIRQLGTDAGVPLLDYPQLTRAIYFTTRAGQPIGQDLYVAVATVLAFVFNLDAQQAAMADKPDINVPDGLRFDAQGKPSS